MSTVSLSRTTRFLCHFLDIVFFLQLGKNLLRDARVSLSLAVPRWSGWSDWSECNCPVVDTQSRLRSCDELNMNYWFEVCEGSATEQVGLLLDCTSV